MCDFSYFKQQVRTSINDGDFEKTLSILNTASNKDDCFEYNMAKRKLFTSAFSWATPTPTSVNSIVSFANGDTILEVGAGSGLWSATINLHPTNPTCIATDDFSSHYKYNSSDTFTSVEKSDAISSIDKYTNANVLMIVWPPNDSNMSFDALSNFKGDKLIYIGCTAGGCTGTDDFYTLLKTNWKLKEVVPLKNWCFMDAKCFLFTRNIYC